MLLKNQKYLIISLLFSINTVLSITSIIYEDKWYVYLFVLALASLFNSIGSIGNILYKMITSQNYDIVYRENPNNYVYVIPCYNESKEELESTLKSLTKQITTHQDKKMLIIICDGKIKGKGNNKTTDKILIEDILNNNNNHNINNAYKTWDDKYNNLELYTGKYSKTEYILIVKDRNVGKRDSLVLVRRLLLAFNKNIRRHSLLSDELLSYFDDKLDDIFESTVEYVIGTDADTVFELTCTEELLKTIQMKNNIVGCVGFVDISKECNSYSPYVLYQYAEYYYSQCLKRQQQSNITHKVNCLSGCVQILKICDETCGDYILGKFNYLPKTEDNIFKHIRSYASEDRNHVCLMLSEFPYIETRQSLRAVAYTKVPMDKTVFLSQRRRWSLGSLTNDMLLVVLPKIKLYERLSALTNIITYSTSPFIFIATVMFIRSIIKNSSLLMLYLSIIIMIPITYGLLIPIFIKRLTFKESMYYYLSFLFYITIGSIINLIIYINSIINMDVIKWGKTRTVEIDNIEIDV